MDSGPLKLIQTVAFLADCTKRTLKYMHLLVLTTLEPPQEVLFILAKA